MNVISISFDVVSVSIGISGYQSTEKVFLDGLNLEVSNG